MTHVEVLNKVKEHLLKQGAKSKDIEFGCMYRDKNGRKCAVGLFIPDDVYDPDMETYGNHIRLLLASYPKVTDILKGIDIGFLLSLQHLHDSNPVDAWSELLDGKMQHAIALDELKPTC